MSDTYLNQDGVGKLWQKTKQQSQPGDGLSKESGVLNVTTPVRGILTQKEFDSLSDTEKNSGLYVIDDGALSQGDIWSVNETRIGTWIDGKPLYRMVFNLTLPTADTSDAELAVTADNKNVVNLYGMFLWNNRQSQPLNAMSETNSFTYLFYRRGSLRIVLKGSNFYGKSAWVTIEYTKTTDSSLVSEVGGTE